MAESSYRLAVLGSPIDHSKSPAIHRAAYRALGLDWEYSALEVGPGGLGVFFEDLSPEWRGLSLTMPLKREVLPVLDEPDEVTRLVGAANTVLFDQEKILGFNTDVYGAERMLREAIPDGIQSALILGGGATACSVAVALARCGAREIVVSTRSPQKSTELVAIADRLGIALTVGDASIHPGTPDIVVSTVPGTAPLARGFSVELRRAIPLVDIAYDPWPTPLASHWIEGGGGVVNNGLGMLVYQALAQVRVFVGGDPCTPLPHEPEILATMRRAALDPS